MEKIVQSLLAGKLEMPMVNCVLRQCGADASIVYEGPGLLSQENDKAITLRVFAAHVETSEAFSRLFNRDYASGELIGDSHYYDFKGSDSYGNVWTADRISIAADFGSGTYVRARPRILKKVVDRASLSKRPVAVAFIPRKIELPWHAVTEKDERGGAIDRFEKKVGRFEWRIVNGEEGAWLTLKCDGFPIKHAFEKFLHGLSILIGQLLKPAWLSISEENRESTQLFNRLHERNTEKLLSPISVLTKFADDAHFFLERFMETATNADILVEGPCDFVYRYWHRILRSRESDVENSSLVLSVAIEGLIKKTLLSDKDIDSAFVSEVNEAMPILKKAGLGGRALSCVFSSLGAAKLPKVQDTLRRLAKEGVVREMHLKAWRELRNAAAHGSMLEDDDEALQAHLDRYHTCLDLYYRLIFVLIKYEGAHIDYGASDWPTSRFDPLAPTDSLITIQSILEH